MENKLRVSQLEKLKSEIDDNIETLSQRFTEACKEYDRDKANLFFEQSVFSGKMGQRLRDLFPSTQEPLVQTYMMSSMFLRDSFNFLNRNKRIESLHFITGPKVDNTIVLDRIVEFEQEIQNAVFAKGNSDSVRKALIELEKYNHKLYGCFHIHPGIGPESNCPSQTDLRLQQTLDRGKYKVLYAIFSRDGYIRFYSSRNFEIKIYGKGIEVINDGELYHIIKVS